MRRILLIAVAALGLSATPSVAIEVLETAFEVHRTVDGEDVGEATTVVPLRTDDSCWYWYLRLDQTKGEVTYIERLIMPSVPASWGDLSQMDPAEVSPFRLEDNGRIGVSHRKEPLSDGWLSHGWCFLPGDPTGPHKVEVSIGGKLVHRFEFEVVDAPAETQPATPSHLPKRTERTGRFSG
jgi:hypothetical protein